MKVFVAGGAGVIGRHLLPPLVEAGHEVVGTSRFQTRLEVIQSLGARGMVMDALDRDAVRSAVSDARPDAVVHALTALPARGPSRLRHLDATNRLREQGTANLVAAARAAGVRRLIAESFVGVYGLGTGDLLTEESPLPEGDAVMRALRSLEQHVLGIGGICLRYGYLYGSDVPSTASLIRQLRRRMLPLPGGGPGMANMLHIADAAAATVLALEGGRDGRVYNVVDDEPVSFGEFFTALAEATGAPGPMSVPVWLGRLGANYATALAVDSRLRVSNERIRSELGWQPIYPSYREGLREVADERPAAAVVSDG